MVNEELEKEKLNDSATTAVKETAESTVDGVADTIAGDTATATIEKTTQKTTQRSRRKKQIRQVRQGQAHIKATYNNTIITLTDLNGNVIASSSAGRVGFRGPKKSTPYAAGVTVRDIVERSKPYGLQELTVYVKGVGSGREAAIRALHANGIEISTIRDVTPIPHNGCRRPRPRRV